MTRKSNWTGSSNGFLFHCFYWPNACANTTAAPTITKLMIIPIPPWFVNCCSCPSQKTAKLSAPETPPKTANGRHNPGENVASAMVIAAAKSPMPAIIQSQDETVLRDCVLTVFPSRKETPFHSWNVTQNGDMRYTSPWKPTTKAIRYLSQAYNFHQAMLRKSLT